jgi:hypothetical protein
VNAWLKLISAGFRDWYDSGWGWLLIKVVLIPGVCLALACTGIPVLWLPMLLWLGKDRKFD